MHAALSLIDSSLPLVTVTSYLHSKVQLNYLRGSAIAL